ncbi:MAG: hypothetical protein ABR508_08680 [Candidatus Baltobacteraceae bacterium]
MPRALAAATAALAVLAWAGMPAAAQAPPPDAYAIFDRARHVWGAQHYPAYLGYTIAVNVTESGVAKTRHYHVTYDAQNDLIDVNPVSDEEQAAPPTPVGFVLHLQPKRQGRVIIDKKVGNPGEAVDYLGVPKLSPTYAFGLNAAAEDEQTPSSSALVAQIRKEFNDPVPDAKARELSSAGGMKTIAVVSTRTRAYTIALSGVQTIDGHDCYHLLLTPAHDPDRLRLRELWVDRETYQTRQLLSAGNFTGSSVPWLVTFEEVNGAMYIASESAQSPIGVGEHHYEKASIAFETIAPTPRPVHQSSFFETNQTIMTEPDPGNYPH